MRAVNRELAFQELTYWEKRLDNELIALNRSIDFLLLIQPSNLAAIRQSYLVEGQRIEPDFTYRKLPSKIQELQKRLIALPLNKVSNSSLYPIFMKEAHAIKTMLRMLAKRGSPQFLTDSVKLYGEPDSFLVHQALEILNKLPAKTSKEMKNDYVNSQEFLEMASLELDYYRRQSPGLEGGVELHEDLSSIMVTNGKLLVGAKTIVPRCRLEATINHEIGAHMVTFWNGSIQPLGLLSTGLIGYEELQEGLAVFLEYLAGGLTRNRMRTLAARVIAVWRLQDGYSFSEVFEELTDQYGIGPAVSFEIVARTYRGGGMTRPAVYLGGLLWVLEYVQKGGSLDTLLVGKIGTSDILLVEEMLYSGKFLPPLLKPRILNKKEARYRLNRASTGCGVLDLVCDFPSNR